jgi:hypothetical protein
LLRLLEHGLRKHRRAGVEVVDRAHDDVLAPHPNLPNRASVPWIRLISIARLIDRARSDRRRTTCPQRRRVGSPAG